MHQIMASETLTKLVTYDDYRHLPDDGKQYQVIGGNLYMAPAPTTTHQRILRNLSRILDKYVTEKEAGEVLFAPVDVVLSMTDVVQPDLVFVAANRRNIITKKNIVAAPDLVVEILSEYTETIDRKEKKVLYEHHGVKEYWLIAPGERRIEQYSLEKQTLIQNTIAERDDSLFSSLLDGFSFEVKGIFP
jgi:Uma2 family endonuclease